ncbi:MAG: PA0069 family radical SAM protein [Myxococcota bacterium]
MGGRRGASDNPPNRFERLRYAEEPEGAAGPAAEDSPLRTRFFRDPSRRILATNDSPDVGFDTSLNPYRGCEHGCTYCYARPTHEYLGFSAGLDFESRILVKEEAPELLRDALASPRWVPRVVALSGVTDPYQPVEARLGLTRRCLEVFAEFRNPVSIVTKSGLVVRDLDLLGELARVDAVAVYVSITTLDEQLRSAMEPRAATAARRLATVEALAAAGVPVCVLVAPVIPALNDHEIPAIVKAASDAGARCMRHILVRLPHGLSALFADWLERHYPERRQKVLNRIRALRGGRLNDPRFHHRHRGEGPFAEQIRALFEVACRRAGVADAGIDLSTDAFRRPLAPQLSLFAGT